jgi:hypothetical protein
MARSSQSTLARASRSSHPSDPSNLLDPSDPSSLNSDSATALPNVDSNRQVITGDRTSSPADRLTKSQLLQQIARLTATKQLELFGDWMKGLEVANFNKVLDSIKLEEELRQTLGGKRPGRTHALTEVFLKRIAHKRRNSAEMNPPQLYVYIRRRRKASESGTKYLGKLFFVPGGQTYTWSEGVDGSLVFSGGNLFQLTHLRTKKQHYIRLLKIDQPPVDFDYEPRSPDKLAIQVGLHVEFLHPQTLQPTEVRIYDYPSCMRKNGELSDSVWNIEPIQSALPIPQSSLGEPYPLTQFKAPSKVAPHSAQAATGMTVNRVQAIQILPRLRQFRDLSQQVYAARSHWYLSEPSGGLGGNYVLTTSGKLMLTFDTEHWRLSTDHSAQVLARWFYNLCSRVQSGLDRGEYGELSLSDRKWISELFVQLQTVRDRSAEDILRMIFQLE